MMFKLFVDSSNSVDLYPEWDYEEDAEKIENVHRSRTGLMYRYQYGRFEKWSFTTEFVNSETASIVNSWWATNTKLKFYEVTSSGGSTVYDVLILSNKKPFRKRIKPYEDQYEGIIDLGEY